jgi:hypothetical protein
MRSLARQCGLSLGTTLEDRAANATQLENDWHGRRTCISCVRAPTRHWRVSRTVKDLVAGAELRLEERGSYHFKGIDEAWTLYAVITAEDGAGVRIARKQPTPD